MKNIVFNYSNDAFKADVKLDINTTNDGGLDVLINIKRHARTEVVSGYIHLKADELDALKKYLAE